MSSKSGFVQKDIGYMKKVCLLCDKSNCETKSSAIAVKNGKVIGKAHNELFSLERAEKDVPERDAALHAEAVLLATCAKNGNAIKGSVVYCTRYPCMNCRRMLIKAGVKKIFYMSDLFTAGNQAESLFKNCRIPVVQIKESTVWPK